MTTLTALQPIGGLTMFNRFALGLLFFGTLVLIGRVYGLAQPTELVLSSLGLSALLLAAIPSDASTVKGE